MGDNVVVELTGQKWETPKVIGFESNPKPCSVFCIAGQIEGTTDFYCQKSIGDEIKYRTQFVAPYYPLSVSAHENGIYVGMSYFSDTKLSVLNKESGAILGAITLPYTPTGNRIRPNGLFVESTDKIYIADAGANPGIAVINGEGSLLKWAWKSNSPYGNLQFTDCFYYGEELYVISYTNVFYGSLGGPAVFVFNKEILEEIRHWHTTSWETGNLNLRLAVVSDKVFVLNQKGGDITDYIIYVTSLQGEPIGTIPLFLDDNIFESQRYFDLAAYGGNIAVMSTKIVGLSSSMEVRIYSSTDFSLLRTITGIDTGEFSGHCMDA